MKFILCLLVAVLYCVSANAEWNRPLIKNLFDTDNAYSRAYGDTMAGERVWLYLNKSRSGRISLYMQGPGIQASGIHLRIGEAYKFEAFLDGQKVDMEFSFLSKNDNVYISDAKDWLEPLRQAESLEVSYHCTCIQDRSPERIHFNVAGSPELNF